MGFEPRLVGFLCNWCSYTGADLAGTSRIKYAPNLRVIRVMCSARIDPTFVVAAFAEGADGVLVCGCHPGDCHYIEGNYKTMRRYPLLRRLIEDYGIEPQRVRLEWVSASEGERFARVVDRMTEEIRALGPLPLRPALEGTRAESAASGQGPREPRAQGGRSEVTHG
jgi:F420-non-reducing hydrogenase iron-sulfur subunit